jgi:hypothetical protein
LPLPPSPAPPLDVEVVPGVVGVVAGLVGVVGVVGTVVGGLVVVEVVVVGLVVVVEVVVDVVVVDVVVVVQAFAASAATVAAPWLRLLVRVVLTEAGRSSTTFLSATAAAFAWPQLPVSTALLTLSSAAFSEFA